MSGSGAGLKLPVEELSEEPAIHDRRSKAWKSSLLIRRRLTKGPIAVIGVCLLARAAKGRRSRDKEDRGTTRMSRQRQRGVILVVDIRWRYIMLKASTRLKATEVTAYVLKQRPPQLRCMKRERPIGNESP